jgi:hypothetical protein
MPHDAVNRKWRRHVVTAFSVATARKGWLCKTWEGELVTRGTDRIIPAHFFFTVRDSTAVAALRAHVGAPMLLRYTQHAIVTPSCFGDSDYFIDEAVPARS